MREGEGEWREVGVVRLFPLSNRRYAPRRCSMPSRRTSECCAISTALGRSRRELIEDELRRRYLTPVVKAITAGRHRGDVTEWSVETDRGPTTIVIRNVREKVKEPLPGPPDHRGRAGQPLRNVTRPPLNPASRKLLDLEI